MLSLPKHPAVRRIFRYARFFDYAQNDMENFEFYRLFQIGCGGPPQSNHQADNLAKLWQEFLSVTELIAKIFGAVSRTTSLMRLSALIASKLCRCRYDGFCSGVPPTIINYQFLRCLIASYSTMPAATDAFRELTFPNCGMVSVSSQSSLVRR